MGTTIGENIKEIRARMGQAARRAGRDPAEIKLMAVTKMVADDLIREAITGGVDMIGENYVQEAKVKIERLGRAVPWHFTGHLQTNKAKYVVDLFDMIHSVDRLELARELDRRAGARGRTMAILLEVNTGGEESKSGVNPTEAKALAAQVAELPHLSLRGLMTIPPWSDDPEKVRPFFRSLRELKEELVKEQILPAHLAELSMGMSDDFEVAIEEGATIVRIGRAIFGERPKGR